MKFDDFTGMMELPKERWSHGFNALVAEFCGCTEKQVRLWKRRDAVPAVYVILVKMKVRVMKAVDL